MYKVLDTAMAGTALGDKQRFWYQAIQSSVYELDIRFDAAKDLQGMVENCALGSVQWTRVKSVPLYYLRREKHCGGQAPQILLSVPLVGQIEFEQFSRRISCRRGSFLLEHSGSPYRFGYDTPSDLWAIRIPEDMLRSRLRDPARFCAMDFDGSHGAARFLLDYLGAVAGNIQQSEDAVRTLVGQHLVDLLAVALEGDERVLQSSRSSVKAGHLARVEQYLRRNLADPSMSAQEVAAACGISVRYLHYLFEETGWTVTQWIREHRLERAHEILLQAAGRVSIAQLAYQVGFNDHAQFSKAFRKKYDCTPSQLCRRAGGSA